jgi:DNA replication licensing factor MCM2
LTDSALGEVEAIPQSLLKKYIMHAKTLKPSLTRLDMDKVARLYSDMRKESEISNGVPIAVRHIESIIRMSEAAARMRLSSVVSDADLNLAIKVMLDSFISAQKFAVMRTLRRQFARYLTVTTDFNAVLLVKLRELVRERSAVEHSRSALQAALDEIERVEVPLRQLEERAHRHHLSKEVITAFLTSEMLRAAGFEYDDARKVLVRQGTAV